MGRPTRAERPWLALGWALALTTPLSAQFEACTSPGLSIPGDDSLVTSTLAVDASEAITELNCYVDLTYSEVHSTVSITLVSPAGTSVVLVDAGAAPPGFDCTFADNGGVLPPPDHFPGPAARFAREGYPVRPKYTASNPEPLSAFDGEKSAGTWVLEVRSTEPARLERWCVIDRAAPPVSSLGCASGGEGILELSWVNGGDYDALRIYLDDELWTTLDAGPYLAGESVLFANDDPLAVPRCPEIRVAGVARGSDGAPAYCFAPLATEPSLILADLPAATIDQDSPSYFGFFTFDTDLLLEDLQVAADISRGSNFDPSVSITSPAGTSVGLVDGSLGGGDIAGTFWDLAPRVPSVNYACECFLPPFGPGHLSDFVGESTVDPATGAATWVVSVFPDANSSGAALVNAIALRAFDFGPAFAVTDLECSPASTPGVLDVRWRNAANYDELRVFVDGELAATLAGPHVAGENMEYETEAIRSAARVRVAVQGVKGDLVANRARASAHAVVPPVADLACAAGGEIGSVALSWTAPYRYDALEVFVDGTLAATLPGGTMAATIEALETPSVHDFAVRATVRGFGWSEPAVCRAVVADAADLEACATVAAALDPETPTARLTADIAEDFVVESVQVGVELSALLGQWIVSLESPSGTWIRLAAFTLDDYEPLEALGLFFDDRGAVKFEPEECPCLVSPDAAGTLADFAGEPAAGEWTLVVRAINGGEGTVDSWCLRLNGCAIRPPGAIRCEDTGKSILLSWINEDRYDELQVWDRDDLIDTLPGDVESTELVGLDAGRHALELRAFRGDLGCAVTSERCSTLTGGRVACAEATHVGGGEPAESDLVVEAENSTVGAVTVAFELEGRGGVAELSLTSPTETRVNLEGYGYGSPAGHIDLVYSDNGRENGAPFACAGCLMMPTGPGSLGDFAAEPAAGEWTFHIESSNTFGARVSALCLEIVDGCDVAPPTGLACEVDGNEVLVRWENEGAYEEIDVYRDDVLVGSLGGALEQFLDGPVAHDRHGYHVVARTTAAACPDGARSPRCTVSVGFQEICSRGGLEVEPGEIGSDVLAVAASAEADEVRVSVDVGGIRRNDLRLTVTAPSGISVVLHDETGRYPSNLEATYADGAVSPQVEPDGPGLLDDWIGGARSRDWVIEVGHSGVFGAATLSEWCVELLDGCPMGRPLAPSCVEDGDLGTVTLSWQSPQPFDSIVIVRDEVVLAALSGEAETYVDEEPLAAGYHEYRVIGTSDTRECSKTSSLCRVAVGGRASCDETATAVSALGIPAISLLYWESGAAPQAGDEESATLAIGDLQVHTRLDGLEGAEVAIYLGSPAGTEIRLLGEYPLDAGGVRATWHDSGMQFSSSTCECLLQPTGPGALADFAGEDPAGYWALSVISDTEATLEAWCVEVFPVAVPVPPAPRFRRGDADSDGMVIAIVDAVRVLDWGFGAGSPPPCLDAADADNDGLLAPLLDALYILDWGFASGPVPPAPGPDRCGEDPEGGDQGCSDPPAVCGGP